MKDEEYWYAVDQVIDSLPENLDEEWLDTVVAVWREEVAPKKHEEYGVECWERMGTRALVADISAVFYRYKRLTEVGVKAGRRDYYSPLFNVWVDSFGYAVIYTVCKYQELFTEGWSGPTLSDIYDYTPVDREEPVLLTNEQVLRVGWDGRALGYVEALAMRQAYNMWRGLPV